mgnify:CR=1 FL=1
MAYTIKEIAITFLFLSNPFTPSFKIPLIAVIMQIARATIEIIIEVILIIFISTPPSDTNNIEKVYVFSMKSLRKR